MVASSSWPSLPYSYCAEAGARTWTATRSIGFGRAQCGGRATSGSPRLRRALVLPVFRVLRAALFLRLVVRFFARFFRFAIGLTSSISLDRSSHRPSSLRPEAIHVHLPDRHRAFACYMSKEKSRLHAPLCRLPAHCQHLV